MPRKAEPGRATRVVHLPDGTTRRLFAPRGLAKRAAAAWLDDREAGLRSGIAPEGAKMTLSAFLDEWVAVHSQQQTEGGIETYGHFIRLYLRPALGRVPLGKLTAPLISKAYAQLHTAGGARGQGLAASTIDRAHRILHKALNDAVDWKYLESNPATKAVLPKLPTKEKEREQKALLTGAQTQHLYDTALAWEDPYAALWLVLGTSGLRLGEARGLRWVDVDMAACRLLIRQQIRTGKTEASEPKHTRRRVVQVPSATIAALRLHQQRWEWQRTQVRVWHETGLVFTRPDGRVLPETTLRSYFRLALSRAGLLALTPHGMRHSYGTNLMGEGVPSRLIAAQMGHSSTRITDDLYLHPRPEMGQLVTDALDRAMGKTKRNRAAV
jgi:integrase